MPDATENIGKVMSDVLTNRNPPYGIRGGLFDALQETNGRMYGVPNSAGADAMRLTEETVGIDLDPAAAVAMASLVQAVEKDFIGPDDHILLNLTGGGYRRIHEDFILHQIPPAITVTPDEPAEQITEILREWITHHG